mmetsp:Transcript_16084/g.34783  ORF Transcript_16084/g.34783 Transcript_16084/m.34783 type:complete len:315 (+) Transcript_16084:795-1739(+)
MIYVGTEVHFRLRGDTVGYLAELVQGHMISRLEGALLFAVHGSRTEVQKSDLISFSTLEPLSKCNAGTKEHEHTNQVRGCSCSLSSASGTVWRWPEDDCDDVLPPEAGRRIIRGLAYKSGITKMSNEAFVLAEAELLHTIGILLVDAYESSAEMTNTASYLGADETLVYDHSPTVSIDMFKVPPPPFCLADDNDEEDGEGLLKELIHTIVPGHIRAAAERRDIVPYHVYGVTWIASTGFTVEEEKEIEESYYYDAYSDDSSDIEYHEMGEDNILQSRDYYESDSDYCNYDDNDSYSSGEDSDSPMIWTGKNLRT